VRKPFTQSHEFEKIAESILRKEESHSTISRDDSLLAPKVSALSSYLRFTFPYVSSTSFFLASPYLSRGCDAMSNWRDFSDN